MAKGDLITVVLRSSDGTLTMGVEARQNGRKVEIESIKDLGIGWIVVKELTRGNTVVAERRFVAAEVLAIEIDKKEMEN